MKRIIGLAVALMAPWMANATTNADLLTGHPLEAKYTDYIAVEGTVQNINTEDNLIEIQDRNGSIRTFSLDPNTHVWKGTESANIEDVQTGTPVLVKYQRDDQMVSTLATDYETEGFAAP
jgi:hypothetical protein